MSPPRARWLLGLALVVLLVASPGGADEASADADPPQPSSPTAPSTAGQQVFQGAITVSDRPILEGNELDRYGSVVGTVSDRQIDDLYAQDLSAALRRVPGVVISLLLKKIKVEMMRSILIRIMAEEVKTKLLFSACLRAVLI